MTFLVGSVSYANAYVNDSNIIFEAGYRHDDISWKAQVPAHDPLFGTSSKLKDINIFQIGLKGRTTLSCNFYGRASFSVGWVLDGDQEDRFELFASPLATISSAEIDDIAITRRSRNIVDGRFVLDADIAIGYPFYLCDCTMYVAPVVGYAFNEQNFRFDRDDNFSLTSVSGFLLPVGNSGCCSEQFVSRWYGPFIGADFVYHPCGECWGLFAQLEYHWAQYNTKRHTDDDFSDFGRFHHKIRDGHGWVFAAGADYEFCNAWTVGLDFKVQEYRASKRHHHDDSGFFSEDFSGDSHLRSRIHWHSFAINLTLGRDF